MNAQNLRALLARHGLPDAEAVFLAVGASSQAFRAGRVVIRIAASPQTDSRFQADAQIRARLHAAGHPVALPLGVGRLPDGHRYSLDENAEGAPAADLNAAECFAVGRVLSALHALPCSGYGLLQDRPDALVGCADTPTDGFRTRLQDAWPFGESPLSAHPLTRDLPQTWRRLEALRPELLALTSAPVVVCHTDLHAEQLLWTPTPNGSRQLSALLDFGDAACGPASWDVASFAYFHGWQRAEWLQTALNLSSPAGQAELIAVLLAFHRAARALAQQRPARLQEAQAFLTVTLARLSLDGPAGVFPRHL